jgi:hypothetical protein
MSENRPRRRLLTIGLPLVAVLTAACFLWLFPKLRRESLDSSRAAVQEMYEGVKEREFGGDPEVAKRLEEWDHQEGPVMMFQIVGAETSLIGRPTTVRVQTVRGRKRFVETCHLGDSKTITSIEQSVGEP